MRTRFAHAIALFALALTAGAAAAQEGVSLRAVPGPDESSSSVTGNAVAPRYTDTPQDVFILPLFKVDQGNPNGETTLIAVRNVGAGPHDVAISYWVDHPFDPLADPDHIQSFTLNGEETRTVNLRDLPLTGGAGGDAIVRGWLLIEHVDRVGDALSADWFRVVPGQDFATGGRMVAADDSYTCTRLDLRYLVGGGFSGGTRLEVFVDTPLSGEPSFVVHLFDEPGNPVGSVAVSLNRQVAEIPVSNLLATIGGSPANLGAMEIVFRPGTNGGLATAAYRAEGRYSVGLNATCLVP